MIAWAWISNMLYSSSSKQPLNHLYAQRCCDPACLWLLVSVFVSMHMIVQQVLWILIKKNKQGEVIQGKVTCAEAGWSRTIVFILRLFLTRCHCALLHNGCQWDRTRVSLCVCIWENLWEFLCVQIAIILVVIYNRNCTSDILWLCGLVKDHSKHLCVFVTVCVCVRTHVCTIFFAAWRFNTLLLFISI